MCSIFMAALWSRASHYVFVLWFLLLFFVVCSKQLQIRSVPYFYTWCGHSANLECRSEMCCMRLAGNAGRKKIAKNSPSAHHRTTLSGSIATKAHIDNRKQNISPTCPHNMMNFGPLAAEICWRLWGTQQISAFCFLAALLHGTLVVGVGQTLWRSTEGATYIWQGSHHVGHWPTF